jgi:hypothetical protein
MTRAGYVVKENVQLRVLSETLRTPDVKDRRDSLQANSPQIGNGSNPASRLPIGVFPA